MIRLLEWMGRGFLASYPGNLVVLGGKSLGCLLVRPTNRRTEFRQILSQVYFTGVEALPLIFFVAIAIGSVTILQSVSVMPKIGAGDYFGSVMVAVIVREAGPLLTAFLIAGRTGSALSAYLGNMKVQQEIDALVTMGINPIRYLVFPSLAGIVLSMFCLTIIFNAVAVFGGFAVVLVLAVTVPQLSFLELPLPIFVERIVNSMSVIDALMVAAKPLLFGTIVALIACHHGISLSNDIRDVPKATNQAVMNSFFYIILFDSLFAIPMLRSLDILL